MYEHRRGLPSAFPVQFLMYEYRRGLPSAFPVQFLMYKHRLRLPSAFPVQFLMYKHRRGLPSAFPVQFLMYKHRHRLPSAFPVQFFTPQINADSPLPSQWLTPGKRLLVLGAGIAQWLECWTHDRKVVGSNPYRSGGRIFFSRVNFLCRLLFRYPFHPRVTAVARKGPRSLCQKCRWQVTAKHAYTLRMWLCMKGHGAWLYGVHRTRREGSSFIWHQPCQRCKLVHHFGGYTKNAQ